MTNFSDSVKSRELRRVPRSFLQVISVLSTGVISADVLAGLHLRRTAGLHPRLTRL